MLNNRLSLFAVSLVVLVMSSCSNQTGQIPIKHSSDPDKQPKRQDQPAEANQFFVDKRLPKTADALDYRWYESARREASQLPWYSTVQDQHFEGDNRASFSAWEFLGPGNIGGRTRGLVIDHTTPTTLYAAGVAGGVWKSTDSGANWAPLDDMMGNLAVSSLAMDPANAQVLFAGTGEGFYNIDAVRGAGIFVTANGGSAWAQLASTTGSDFRYVNDIVFSPSNSSVVYAATNTGVFRSNDAGASWTSILAASQSGDASLIRDCTDLAIQETNLASDVLFASCYSTNHTLVRNDDVVWRNSNAASTSVWDAVLMEAGMKRTSLAIAPSNHDIMYALAAHDGSVNASYA